MCRLRRQPLAVPFFYSGIVEEEHSTDDSFEDDNVDNVIAR
jgi:hypothetical protein